MSYDRYRRLGRHWLPRLFVVASVAAMVLPTPSFVLRLSQDERILWWSEVIWVICLPLAFLGALLGIVRLVRRTRKSPQPRAD